MREISLLADELFVPYKRFCCKQLVIGNNVTLNLCKLYTQNLAHKNVKVTSLLILVEKDD
jgi:hypothetical protein